MLSTLLSRFTGGSTVDSLRQRKDSILASFHGVLAQLTELRAEQLHAASLLEEQINSLKAEREAIEQMAESTEKTINKISKLID